MSTKTKMNGTVDVAAAGVKTKVGAIIDSYIGARIRLTDNVERIMGIASGKVDGATRAALRAGRRLQDKLASRLSPDRRGRA